MSLCFQVVVIAVLASSVLTIPVDISNVPEATVPARIVRSPKHHHFGGGGLFGGHHGGHYGGHGGQQGGYGGPQGGYGGGPHGGGGSFAGSAAFAGNNGNGGHGGHGGPTQSQSASFAFGPFAASFSQSQASGRGDDHGFYDY